MELKEKLITKSFKDVHIELEQESLFLHKNHNVKDYQEKADFLKTIGFENSIATKLYRAIAENSHVIQSYTKRYNGLYKFILKPQLERICEKYNLYLRDTKYFLGDIPEKNIKDIINFKIYIQDLDISEVSYNKLQNHLEHTEPVHFSEKYNRLLNLHDFKKYNLNSHIQIAAVESLFTKEALEISKNRIIGINELLPKFQVDLDPIVVCRTKHGYLIVTAWGDESNDELVINTNLN